MPDTTIGEDFQKALECMEDYNLDTPWSRSQNYQVVQKALDRGNPVNVCLIERLLSVCEHDMKEDMKYTVNILGIICSILKRVKAGDFPTELNLVPSALAVINIIKTSALLSKTDTLKTLCFETLLAYPDETLSAIAMVHCEEVMEIFSLYGHQRIPLENRIQTCNIVYKLIKILPLEKRDAFVKAGMSVWFSKIIPTIITHLSVANEDNLVPLLALELLTEELAYIDYSDHIQWQMLLENIRSPKKYPVIVKSMLEKGSNIWHRLWIAFIKLLKSQITKSNNSNGSPINAMLHIVETAFKMDVANRCRAFQCWNALIDNFSTETNEGYINKRLKLLVVPLLSNNAKVEETALAKFNTWWHLIIKFEHKLDKYANIILIPFIYFCYGKSAESAKHLLVPGKLSNTVMQLCQQALVEIFGHADCTGCTNIPRLQNGILNSKYLVEYLADWFYAFKTALTLTSKNDNETSRQQVMCLWKSLIKTISNMPDNTVRKDVTNEALSTVSHILNGESTATAAEIVFNLLIHSFDDDKVKQIYKIKDQPGDPIHNVVNILMEPAMSSYYQRYSMKELVQKFKPIASTILDEAVKSRSHVTETLLEELAPARCSLALCTSLAESICESDTDICSFNICDTLLWPLQHMNMFSKADNSAHTWYLFYTSMYMKINKTVIVKEITKILLDGSEITDSVRIWKLYAALAVLKQGLRDTEATRDVADLLCSLITHDVLDDDKEVLPILVDTLVVLTNSPANTDNEVLAQATLSCLRTVLKYLSENYTENSQECHLNIIKNLLNPVETLFKDGSSNIKSVISDILVEFASLCSKQVLIIAKTLPLMKSCLLHTDDKQIHQNLKNAIDSVDGTNNSPAVVHQNLEEKAFSTPNTKAVVKKGKKEEASIVNTVVENGEEFVVVKSNWKFNPKKLTENQREKLQRKREDIPALYQDLSQSQDEFKLKAWKTDSQDASSTASKSDTSKSTTEESSSILKNMPNTNVVPKIMENLLTDNSKNGILPKESDHVLTRKSNTLQELASPRNKKTPRMALKDRVFRNVRNLIESSNSPHKNNLMENEKSTKTPTTLTNMSSYVTNSAPSMISSERPSRVKRKPRKFEDSELFALKRRKGSISQNDSQSCINLPETEIKTESTEIEHKQSENCANIAVLVHDTPNMLVVPMEVEDPVSKVNVIESTTDITAHSIVDDLDMKENYRMHPKKQCADTIVLDSESTTDIDATKNTIKDSESTNFKDSEISENTEIGKEAINNIITKESEEPDKYSNVIVKEDLELTKIADSELNKNVDVHINKMTIVDNAIENVNSEKVDQIKVSTPTPIKVKQEVESKSTSKKNKGPRKSRIEKELAIDMVEGHPFLQIQSEKRLTRKHLTSVEGNNRRKSLHDKLNKTRLNFPKKITNLEKKTKDKGKTKKCDAVAVSESEQPSMPLYNSPLSEEQPCSDDVIESSQDSTFTTISVISTTKKPRKVPLVSIVNMGSLTKTSTAIEMQNKQYNESLVLPDVTINQESKEDIELPGNYTALEKTVLDSTENMDTEPINEKGSSDDVIINEEDSEVPITISTEDTIGPETQELAEADTQPCDFIENRLPEIGEYAENGINNESNNNTNEQEVTNDREPLQNTANEAIDSSDEPMQTDIPEEKGKTSETSSPCKDDAQRKKDFLNNTFEISPIKTMSPDREKKSPSPETSGEYVVIKLSSPVHSNGEPFETHGSPEFFTEDKLSPDKRDLSPPRAEVSITNTSPSSSLSLKKNRPQVRSGGRGAQMLGLCVPERDQLPSKKCDRVEMDETNKNPTKSNTCSTPARRNLRILYNTVSDTNDSTDDSEESENFLKLRRMLPTVDSSPSGPILKRKLAEIVDDATISPASKRKRVSFHDPPVSTTISVHKYIEPCGVRSPQNSAQKRLERQMRMQTHTHFKSQKRLDTAFKLDSALTKTIESFADIGVVVNNDDTQISSLEQTPALEVVKNCDLNDTEPIYPDLINCKDSIDNIAADLSSAAMKYLLIKELVGKVETVGDLAKMTELQVNRLCIKAPKVQVARKALAHYAYKVIPNNDNQNHEALTTDEEGDMSEISVIDAQMQTFGEITYDVDMQTDLVKCSVNSTQTECVLALEKYVQTKESSFQLTADVISSCLAERQDFIDQLSEKLETASIQRISGRLSAEMLTDVIKEKMTASNSSEVLTSVLQEIASSSTQIECSGNKQLSFLSDYLSNKFDSNDIILFCSQLLQRVHDKP